MSKSKLFVILICILSFQKTFSQTYTIGTGPGVQNFDPVVNVCEGTTFKWSVPNLGNNLVYNWSFPSPFFSIISQDKNEIVVMAVSNPYNIAKDVFCTVNATDSQNPDIYFVERYRWAFKVTSCTPHGSVADPLTANIQVGDEVTFIIPNYGTPTNGITYDWRFTPGFLKISSSNNSITVRAISPSSGNLMCVISANGQAFTNYIKYFTISSPPGGGSGGGVGGCDPQLSISQSKSNSNFVTLNVMPCETVKKKLGSTSKKIIAYNMNGTKILEREFQGDTFEFNKAELGKGLSILHIYSGDKVITKKVIME